MTIVTASGKRSDDYRRIDDVEAAADTGGAIPLVPLALAEAFIARQETARFGLCVQNDTSVDAISPYLGRASLIAVEFPAFSDGRGFSLARRLRRVGFRGRLRASGPLIADQFADALACGFDEVELPMTMVNRQPVQQWLAAKDIVTLHYQNGYGATHSILQQRREARARASS